MSAAMRQCMNCGVVIAETDATHENCVFCRNLFSHLTFVIDDYPMTPKVRDQLIASKSAFAKSRRNLAKAMAKLLFECAQVADLMEARGFVCNAFEQAQEEAKKALAAEMGGSDDEQSPAPSAVADI